MNYRGSGVLLVLTILSIIYCYPQEKFEAGNKVNPSLALTLAKIDSTYTYDYCLANGADARQDIVHFFLISPFRTHVSALTAPTAWTGVRFERDKLTVKWLANPKKHVEGYIEPLHPGKSTAGFRFASMDIPGLVAYYVEGDHPIPSFPEGMAVDSIPGYTDLTPYGPGIVGKTVGPVPPPSPFIVCDFLDTLLSYARQSAELGWLGSKDSKRGVQRDDDCDNDERPDNGIAGNVERRLQMARHSLEEGDSVKAHSQLETLLHKVERIWKRSQDEDKKRGHDREQEMRGKEDKIIMTSEAYALLKYNLQYIIDRLPERAKPEKEPRREGKK